MAVALIADAHLGGPGGDGRRLVEQLSEISPEGCERVVFLGDLFHIWIGDSRFETEVIRRVVAAIRSLRSRGVPTIYIEGNRDFFLADSEYADAFDFVGLEYDFSTGGKRYLAVHGDGLNDLDLQYRFWRRLSKNGLSRWLCRHLPRRLARRVIDDTESRLAKTNFKHKSRIPEQPIRRYGGRRLSEGCDVVLLGHFHEPRSFGLETGEVRILNAWFRDPSVVWI